MCNARKESQESAQESRLDRGSEGFQEPAGQEKETFGQLLGKSRYQDYHVFWLFF